MWPGETQAWLLLIGATRVSFGARGMDPQSIAWGTTATLDDVCAGVREVVGKTGQGAHAGRGSLRVVISDRWLGAVALPWSPSLADRGAARLLAGAVLMAAGTVVSEGDRVVIDDAPYRAARCGVAFPEALVLLAESLCRERGLRLSVIEALPAAVCAAERHRSGPVALVEDGWMRLWMASSGRIVPVGAGRVTAVGGDARSHVLGLWTRARLRDPVLAGLVTLEVCDLRPGTEPTAWSDPSNTLRVLARGSGTAWDRMLAAPAARSGLAIATRERTSAGGWMAVTGAVLFAAASLVLAWRQQGEVQVRQAELAAVSARQEAPRRAAPDRAQLARDAAVASAIGQLNFPFDELLRSLRSPRDLRVGLLSIDVAAGGPSPGAAPVVKLTAEAASGDEMTRYVDWLADRKVFDRAHLLSHEVQESDGRQTYRFSVEATWRD